jgi:hypothetical protein
VKPKTPDAVLIATEKTTRHAIRAAIAMMHQDGMCATRKEKDADARRVNHLQMLIDAKFCGTYTSRRLVRFNNDA